eukprot:350272-Chlamydomonas_euryale.AAC.10
MRGVCGACPDFRDPTLTCVCGRAWSNTYRARAAGETLPASRCNLLIAIMSTNASGHAGACGGGGDADAAREATSLPAAGSPAPERPADESILEQQNAIRAESSSQPYVGDVAELSSLKSGECVNGDGSGAVAEGRVAEWRTGGTWRRILGHGGAWRGIGRWCMARRRMAAAAWLLVAQMAAGG